MTPVLYSFFCGNTLVFLFLKQYRKCPLDGAMNRLSGNEKKYKSSNLLLCYLSFSNLEFDCALELTLHNKSFSLISTFYLWHDERVLHLYVCHVISSQGFVK